MPIISKSKIFYLNKILLLLMMDIAKPETSKIFTILSKALLFAVLKLSLTRFDNFSRLPDVGFYL